MKVFPLVTNPLLFNSITNNSPISVMAIYSFKFSHRFSMLFYFVNGVDLSIEMTMIVTQF